MVFLNCWISKSLSQSCMFYIIWQMCYLTVSFNSDILSNCLDIVQIVPLWHQFFFSVKWGLGFCLTVELWCFKHQLLASFQLVQYIKFIWSSNDLDLSLACFVYKHLISFKRHWRVLGSVYTLWYCGNQNNISIIVIVSIFMTLWAFYIYEL